MLTVDLKHGNSLAGISDLAAGENHRFLFTSGVRNLDPGIRSKFIFKK